MINKTSKILIFCLVMLIFSSSFAFGWKMTKELRTELDEKLKAVELNKNSAGAHFDLAITYAYTNYVQEGWEELKKVHELDPKFAYQALLMYSDASKNNPNDWKLLYRLAFSLYFCERKQEAIDQFKNILKLQPKNVFAYGYIGLIYGEMDRESEGIKWIKKGIKIDGDVAALHFLLSTAYYKKGDSWAGFFEGVEALRLKALGF